MAQQVVAERVAPWQARTLALFGGELQVHLDRRDQLAGVEPEHIRQAVGGEQ